MKRASGSGRPCPASSQNLPIEEADDAPPDGAQPEGEVISQDEDELREMMSAFAFEEEDVKEELAELCDWISEYAKSDHWKLSERQKRMLGRPVTLLLNSLWAKLSDYLPVFLQSGATARQAFSRP